MPTQDVLQGFPRLPGIAQQVGLQRVALEEPFEGVDELEGGHDGRAVLVARREHRGEPPLHLPRVSHQGNR